MGKDQQLIDRMNGLALGIEAFWDDIYGWRIGDVRIPDPEMPSRTPEAAAKRVLILTKYQRDVADYWFHQYKPSPGDVIVDIGAGRGEDVYEFSRAVGATGQVWAVEPHPVSFLALSKLCEWNQLSNVRLFNMACTERAQQLSIETMPVWESSYVHDGAGSENSHPVEGMPFDELAAREGMGHVDYLKMNIEGAERQALPGCTRVLDRTQNVTIAAHDFRADRGEGEQFRTLGLVREFLAARGFSLTTRDEDRRYYVPYHVHGTRA